MIAQLQLPKRFAALSRGLDHWFDAELRLSRSQALDALARARMALHEAALEMEEAVGGLVVGDVSLGVGTIARTHAASFAGGMGRRTVAELAQVGLASCGLFRLWLDERGWVYAEGAIAAAPPQRQLDQLLLDVVEGELPRDQQRVAWDPRAVRICFDAAPDAAVVSIGSLVDLARMALEAQALEPATALELLDAAPTLAFREAPGEPYRRPVLGIVPTHAPPRRILFHQDSEREVGWYYLDGPAPDW